MCFQIRTLEIPTQDPQLRRRLFKAGVLMHGLPPFLRVARGRHLGISSIQSISLAACIWPPFCVGTLAGGSGCRGPPWKPGPQTLALRPHHQDPRGSVVSTVRCTDTNLGEGRGLASQQRAGGGQVGGSLETPPSMVLSCCVAGVVQERGP